ncbi:MAG TPA: hypothetical protein VG737_12820 [Cyclobacteriaceae bacterium]|nr:hypothetical protein [Cyclobacteriaceae bacterium]
MRFWLSGLLALTLYSCGKDLPTLEGIDAEKWKSDKNACLGNRNRMQPAIQAEMVKLKGLKEMDIVSLLGRPDANELYKRNQKFYYYYLSPGPACPARDSTTHRLVLRFNAMGYAQLVSIDKI